MDVLQCSLTRGAQHVNMKRKPTTLLFLLLLVFGAANAQRVQHLKIKPDAVFNMEVREPSDLVYAPASNTLFVASDNGFVAEVDLEGKLIRISEQVGYDVEGITLVDNQLYVVDEFTRFIAIYDLSFNRIRNVRVTYGGGRNKSFESITWVPSQEVFLMMTEKDPIWVFALDRDLRVLDEFELPFSPRDVSALTWHDGDLWILSDEDRAVYRVTYPGFVVKQAYRLPIINPEGIAFDREGNLLISSDDRERLYRFNLSTLKP